MKEFQVEYTMSVDMWELILPLVLMLILVLALWANLAIPGGTHGDDDDDDDDDPPRRRRPSPSPRVIWVYPPRGNSEDSSFASNQATRGSTVSSLGGSTVVWSNGVYDSNGRSTVTHTNIGSDSNGGGIQANRGSNGGSTVTGTGTGSGGSKGLATNVGEEAHLAGASSNEATKGNDAGDLVDGGYCSFASLESDQQVTRAGGFLGVASMVTEDNGRSTAEANRDRGSSGSGGSTLSQDNKASSGSSDCGRSTVTEAKGKGSSDSNGSSAINTALATFIP